MRYLLKRKDGGVSILELKHGVVERELEKLKTVGIEVESYHEISLQDLPEDRYFRDAWGFDGSINIDMQKAKNIHMDNIRLVRDEKLKQLDIETLKGNDVQAEKQNLRDIPQTFDLSVYETPESLKDAWPEGLDRL